MAFVPAGGGGAGLVCMEFQAEVRQFEDEEVIDHDLMLHGEVLPAHAQHDLLVELLEPDPVVASPVGRELDDAWKRDIYPTLHHRLQSLGDDKHGYISSVLDRSME